MFAEVTNYPYPGVRFTEKTLSEMKKFVFNFQHNPSIVKVARSIIASCPNKDYYCEAETIFRWVKSNIHYVRDPNNCEWVQSPLVSLQQGFCDCDCGATLLDSLYGAIGLATGFEAIKADASHPDEFSHVYAVVKTPRGWRAADWTVPESFFGWRPTRGVIQRKIVLNQ
jgi:hypothetical protein